MDSHAVMAAEIVTKTALQIVLSVGEFTPGVYVSDDYGLRWRKKP